jgi:hypothetical protein
MIYHATAYTSSQNKRVVHYCRLCAVDDKMHSQTCSIKLMRVSVPVEEGSQQSSTFTHAPWVSTEVPYSCLY